MKKNKKTKIGIVGNIVTNSFHKYIKSDKLNFTIKNYNFNQVFQVLNSRSELDVLIVHLTKDYFINDGYSVNYSLFNLFAKTAYDFCISNKTILILNNIDYQNEEVVLSRNFEFQNKINILNKKLFNLTKKINNIFLYDLNTSLNRLGYNNSFLTRNNFIFKMPYSVKMLSVIGAEYTKIIEQYYLPRKKMIIVDGDNTLWGGILGEDGINNLKIGNEYPGIIYNKFQNQIISLSKNGFLIVLLTKNNQSDIDEIFKSNLLVLKKYHFAKIIANWLPKSQNIRKLLTEFNILPESAIFIDDNLFEINEISQNLKDIDTYQFDYSDDKKSLKLFSGISNLIKWKNIKEDKNKLLQYKQEFKRKKFKNNFSKIDKFIDSLEIEVTVSKNDSKSIERISQLTNKTNQFNLTSRRYSSLDIKKFITDKEVDIFSFRVKDKFGDMGIVGLVIINRNVIDTFLLSCRAFGRNIELVMLKYVVSKSSKSILTAEYIPTKKNILVQKFYSNNGFIFVNNKNNSIKKYKYSSNIKVQNKIKIKFS